MNKRQTSDVLLLLLGAVLIGVCLAVAHFVPETFERVQLQMRVLTAIGGGLLGTALPGLVGIEFKGVRAVGAAGFVVIFFLLSPAAEPAAHGGGAQSKQPSPPAGTGPANKYDNSPHTQGDNAKVQVTYDQRQDGAGR